MLQRLNAPLLHGLVAAEGVEWDLLHGELLPVGLVEGEEDATEGTFPNLLVESVLGDFLPLLDRRQLVLLDAVRSLVVMQLLRSEVVLVGIVNLLVF